MSRYNTQELAITLFEEAGDALLLFDPETEELVDANPMAQRLTGIGRSELLRLPVTYLFRSEKPGGLLRLRQAFQKTGVFHSQEGFQLRSQNAGVWIPVNISITRLHAEPKTLGMITVRDVREQREAFAQLQKLELELRRVLTSVSAYVWTGIHETHGAFVLQYISPAAERILGQPPNRYYAGLDPTLSAVHCDDRPRVEQAFRDLRTANGTEAEIDFRIIRPDGGTRWLRNRITVNRPNNGHGVQFDGIVTDTTEHKQAEAALKGSEERYRTLVENSQDMIAEVGLDGQVYYSSPNHLEMLGYESSAAIDLNTFAAMHPDDLPMAKGEWGKPTIRAVYRFQHRNGAWRWLESAAKLFAPPDAAPRYIIVTRDVTKRKQAEMLLATEKRILEMIACGEPLQEVLEAICLCIEESSPEKRCMIWLVASDESKLRFGVAPSLPHEFRRAIDGFAIGPEAAPFARAVHLRETVVVADFPADPAWAELLPLAGANELRACWSTPIFATDGRVLGTFTVFFRQPRGPSAWGEHLVERACQLAAIAIEHQRAGEAVRESEQRLRRLLATAHVIPWEADYETGAYTYIGAQAEQILDYPVSDWFTGHFWVDHLHPDDRDWVVRFCSEQHPQATDYECEYRMLAADGRTVWLHDTVSLAQGADGRRMLHGFMVDITKLKGAEESLRASEARYRTLFERNLAGVFRNTWDGRILECNPAFARIFGYDSVADMLAHRTWDCYFDAADREAFLERIEQNHGALTNYEHRQRRKDDSPVWVLENVTLSKDGDQKILEGTIIDLTARKVVEDALRTSEAKYRVLIENLEQSVFLKDGDFRYIAANKQFCQGVALTEAELVGKTDFDLFPKHLAEKYRTDDLTVLLEDRRLEVEEQTYVDGKQRTVRVIKTPVKDAQGRVTGVLGIFWDVTEQRVLEAQLRQAQKMDAVGQLAGGVAHDFNNLLTAILGNLSLVLTGMSTNDPHRELVSSAEKAALRSADLVRKLLGFSRRTMLRLEPLDVNTAVRETLAILRPALDPRITFDIQAPAEAWLVQADASQINQVLMNLCLNARDAMSEGGALRLLTDNVVVDEVYVRKRLQARPGEFVRIRVQDTGHGMTPDVQARIFEPFFTTKGPGKGLGLGLAMVFGIVEQHRGWLECRSEVNAGTTFDIYLPRYTLPSASKTTPPVPRGPCWGNETILLVEDEAILRHLGAAILQRYGYQVLLAEDGVQALEVYTEHKGNIDLVFLDLTMPRLAGKDTFVQLAKMDPDVRVLFTSGYSAESPVVGEPGQVLGFLGKPYRPEDLALTIRSALDQAKQGKKNRAQRLGGLMALAKESD